MRTLCSAELAMVSGGISPGDGVWEPGDYEYYEQQAQLYNNLALGSGSAAAAFGTIGAISAPSGGGAIFGFGMMGLSSVAALTFKQIADDFEKQAEKEAEDKPEPET